MSTYMKIVNSLNEWTGRICGWTIVVVMILVILEVFMRRVLNSPTIWNFEVVVQLFGFYFIIIIGYGLLHNCHVSVDFISEKLTPINQAILGLLFYLIFFIPFSVVIFWQSLLYAAKAWACYERSSSYFAPPLYPIKTSIVLAALLLLLQYHHRSRMRPESLDKMRPPT